MNKGSSFKFTIPDPYDIASANTTCFCCKEKIRKGQKYRGLFGASICIECDKESLEKNCSLDEVSRWKSES